MHWLMLQLAECRQQSVGPTSGIPVIIQELRISWGSIDSPDALEFARRTDKSRQLVVLIVGGPGFQGQATSITCNKRI